MLFNCKTVILAIVALASSASAAPGLGQKCYPISGGSGTCQYVSNCKGMSYAGYCDGNYEIKCCVKNNYKGELCKSGNDFGVCQNPKQCSGRVVSGLCSGGQNNKCCLN